MTIVGALGIILGFLTLPFASLRRERKTIFIFAIIAVLHMIMSYYYYMWAKTNVTDSQIYYFDELNFYDDGFGLGSQFVVFFVQLMRDIIGGTYLDYFLIFQATGTWALAFMMRIIEEAHLEVEREPLPLIYVLLLIPSFHFFTSSIGKDGPLAMAVAMAVWAVMAMRQRIWVLAAAITVMVLFRPHIALLAIIAFMGALVADPRRDIGARVGLAVGAIAAGAVVARTVQSTFAVDITSPESLSDFFARQSESAEQFTEGTAVLGASYPVRLLSLLFRPLFFDANDSLGYVASLENIMGLLLVAVMVAGWRELVLLFRRIFFVRFALLFALALTVLLAAVYYNVGLGMRQRTMIAPAIVAFLAALLAIRWPGRSTAPSGVMGSA